MMLQVIVAFVPSSCAAARFSEHVLDGWLDMHYSRVVADGMHGGCAARCYQFHTQCALVWKPAHWTFSIPFVPTRQRSCSRRCARFAQG